MFPIHSRSSLFIMFQQNVSTSHGDGCQLYILSRDTENDWVIYFKASKYCEVTFIPHVIPYEWFYLFI